MIDSIETVKTQQILLVFENDPYDFKDEVNKQLKRLGNDVINLQMSEALLPGLCCVIVYWGA
jgi:hypothetical protein